MWPIPPTRVTNSLRFFPPAGGCGPSGPKPHATKPASSRLPLALVTRPPDVDSHPAPTPQACVMLTHTTLHTAHCTSTFALLPCFLYCSTYCVCVVLTVFLCFMLCVVLTVFVCFYVYCMHLYIRTNSR